MDQRSQTSGAKLGLHPRNRHSAGYDFAALTRACPELVAFVRPNPSGADTIDFADPAAVKTLNRALLRHHYGMDHWDIPGGYLCPPVPGRADYVHHLADVLANGDRGNLPRGPAIRILDIGVGANCIYPLIGSREYGWRFVGTEIDPLAADWARQIVAANPMAAGAIEIRRQTATGKIFEGVVRPGETFAASMCNPPFHVSAAAADAGTRRKLRNLGARANLPPRRNFGGQPNELWCPGGEVAFVRRMIAESATRPALCGWFTTLVSSRDSLPPIERELQHRRASDVKTIALAHGQKRSRIVAWRFAGNQP